jgi:hypothetical protein
LPDDRRFDINFRVGGSRASEISGDNLDSSLVGFPLKCLDLEAVLACSDSSLGKSSSEAYKMIRSINKSLN